MARAMLSYRVGVSGVVVIMEEHEAARPCCPMQNRADRRHVVVGVAVVDEHERKDAREHVGGSGETPRIAVLQRRRPSQLR